MENLSTKEKFEKRDLYITQIYKIAKVLKVETKHRDDLRVSPIEEVEEELIRLLKIVALPETIIQNKVKKKRKISPYPQSGVKNIIWYKNYSKWMVLSYRKGRKKKTIGYYSNLVDAIKAKTEWEKN